MAIGVIIGIVSSVIQAVRAFNPLDPPQMADKLFSQIDTTGQGSIQGADLQTAFEKIKSDATTSADKLFSRLDVDGDGKITKNEFSSSINQLAEQLDHHYMRLRMHGEGGVPPPAGDAGFTREELSGVLSNIGSNFEKADIDGDGRVSLKEARAFGQANTAGSTSAITTAVADSSNVELMLQVVRLMQAYGVVHGSNEHDNSKASKVSDKV